MQDARTSTSRMFFGKYEPAFDVLKYCDPRRQRFLGLGLRLLTSDCILILTGEQEEATEMDKNREREGLLMKKRSRSILVE